jgi:hypothetical protein
MSRRMNFSWNWQSFIVQFSTALNWTSVEFFWQPQLWNHSIVQVFLWPCCHVARHKIGISCYQPFHVVLSKFIIGSGNYSVIRCRLLLNFLSENHIQVVHSWINVRIVVMSTSTASGMFLTSSL